MMPAGSEFFGVYAADGGSDWHWGRFSSVGDLLASVPLPRESGRWFAVDAALSSDGTAGYVLLARENGLYEVVGVDVTNEMVAGRFTLEGNAAALGVLLSGTVVVQGEDRRVLEQLSADLSSVIGRAELPGTADRRDRVTGLAVHPASQSLVLAAQGQAQAYLLAPPYVEAEALRTVRSDFEAHRLAPWPANEEMMVVAGNRELTYEGLVGLLHVPSGRYLYPLLEVSPGTLSKARLDRAGRVLLIAPWTGDLIRLSPPAGG